MKLRLQELEQFARSALAISLKTYNPQAHLIKPSGQLGSGQ